MRWIIELYDMNQSGKVSWHFFDTDVFPRFLENHENKITCFKLGRNDKKNKNPEKSRVNWLILLLNYEHICSRNHMFNFKISGYNFNFFNYKVFYFMSAIEIVKKNSLSDFCFSWIIDFMIYSELIATMQKKLIYLCHTHVICCTSVLHLAKGEKTGTILYHVGILSIKWLKSIFSAREFFQLSGNSKNCRLEVVGKN